VKSSLLMLLVAFTIVVFGCQQPRPQPSSSLGGAEPVQLTDANFHNEVIENDAPVLVDMWAPSCQPCIAMKPTVRELATELQGVAKVGELNVEENEFIRQKYGIDMYPMLLVFVGGREVERLVGTPTRDTLLAAVLNCRDEQSDSKD